MAGIRRYHDMVNSNAPQMSASNPFIMQRFGYRTRARRQWTAERSPCGRRLLVARNVNMCFKHIAILSAFCLAADAATAEALRGMSPLAQAETESVRTAPSQIQNVQRLLKLLADRYPKKYGSVDPGRVDGSFGTETKDAIRNFQKISGSKASAASPVANIVNPRNPSSPAG